MTDVFSGSCEPLGKHADACDMDLGLCGFHGALEALGQSAAPNQPSESSLDDPAAPQDFEALFFVRPLDDLHRELAESLHGAPEFRSRIPEATCPVLGRRDVGQRCSEGRCGGVRQPRYGAKNQEHGQNGDIRDHQAVDSDARRTSLLADMGSGRRYPSLLMRPPKSLAAWHQ